MKRLEKYYEKKDVGGNNNGEKPGVLTVLLRTLDQGGQLYVEVLEGKGQSQERVSSSRGNMGFFEK